ncbi:MAG: autotransporter-associated beta strand repeat-containing protein, partial [Planctomycetota bacterium]|nr:autotransporter-associated beta strand repeat-containing protein [Planctomycetota bacterium]
MFRRNTRSLLGLLIAATLGLALVTPAQAVNYTWNNVGTGIWDTTATNWSGSGSLTPWDSTNGIGNTAVFNTAGATATVSGTVYTNGITFGNTATVSGGDAINLAGTTPTITATNNGTISSVLDGTAGLTKAGNGTLTLSGANIYTGTTTVGGGTLQVGDGITGSLNGTTGTDLTFAGSGKFNVNQAANVNQGMGALAFSAGDGTIQSTYTGISGSDKATLTFASVAARPAGATANFVVSGGNNGSDVKIIITAAPATGQLIDRGYFFGGSSYAAYDSGSGGFVRDYGAGDTNYVSVAGGETMGVVVSTDNVALAGNITAQTTTWVNTLNLGANTFAMATAADVLSTDGILSSGNAAATFNTGKLQPTTAGGEMVVCVNASTDVLTVGSTIQDNTTASSLTKTGAGTLTLSGTHTYTGTTTVNAGTLKLMASGTLSTMANRVVTVSGGILNNNGQGYIIGNGASDNKLTVTGSGSRATNNYNIQVGTASASSNDNILEVLNGGYASVDSNNGFFVGNNGGSRNKATIDGADSQMIVGWNGSGTPVRIYGNDGALTVSNGGYMYSSWQFNIGGTNYGNGNTLTVTDPGSSLYDGGPMLLGRNSTGNKVIVKNGGLLTLGGNITVGERGGSGNTITVTDAGSQINIPSASILSVGGSNNVVNVNSGGFITAGGAGGGTWNLGDGNLGTGGVLSTVKANTLTAGTLNINNGKFLAMSNQAAAITGTVTLNGPAYIDTASYTDTIAVAIGGTGSLTKQGAGTLTLSGANIYTGPTIVNGGTLQVASSIKNVNNIDIGADSTLATSATVRSTNVTSALNIEGGSTPTGTLDLNDGLLAINYTGASPIDVVRAQIVSAYNATAGGDWGGPGITSALLAGG